MSPAGILYVLGISLLLSLASAAASAALRLRGRPARWIWAGSVLGSLTLPALGSPGIGIGRRVLRLFTGGTGGGVPDQAAAGGPVPGTGRGLLGAPEAVDPGAAWLPDMLAAPLPDPVESGAQLLWAAASLAVLGSVALAWIRIRSGRRRWPVVSIAGTPVRISPDTGPAAAGFVRPFVVLPARVLQRPVRELRVVVGHEREHVRARDPALLTAGALAVAVTPWNPVLWWQFRRLRLAVELDCDRRILESGASVSEYGEVLLATRGDGSAASLPLAALTRPRSDLERRIRAMTNRTVPFGGLRAAVLALLSVVLVIVACDTPRPAAPQATDAEAPDEDVPLLQREAATAPTFVPRDVDPRTTNDAEIRELLQRYYPPTLRDAGVGGEVTLWIFVNTRGTVEKAQIQDSSGHDALDEAALEVARHMEFEPAMGGGEPVGVWVSRRIRFAATSTASADPQGPAEASGAVREPGRPDPSAVALNGDRGEGWIFTGEGRSDAGTRTARFRISGDSIHVRLSREGDVASGTIRGPEGEERRIRFRRGGGRLEPGSDLSPLTLVDGEPAGSDALERLAPSEIASIEVLKGPTAVERYGPEAKHGVLLVRTRGAAR